MSKEFDHDMAEARGRCGLHYIICVEASDKAQDNMTSVPDGAKLEMTIFQPVMDYFDTLGYLLRNSLVEEQLTRETFRYYFAGYFMATESFLREKQKGDPTFYENVFFLNKAWGKDPSLNSTRDLEIFFKGERARGK